MSQVSLCQFLSGIVDAIGHFGMNTEILELFQATKRQVFKSNIERLEFLHHAQLIGIATFQESLHIGVCHCHRRVRLQVLHVIDGLSEL